VSKPPIHKVLIYATWEGRLLVFDEPDFPEILPQVPGGTVEPSETYRDAAGREFTEESGLHTTSSPFPLTTAIYSAVRNGETVFHERHFFHIALAGPFPDSWTNVEMFPYGENVPVTFRFFWVAIEAATAVLGYEQQSALPFLRDIIGGG
jgi:ADP-ribose pyrophosphatase YjhB (NUDIX family)